MTTETVNRNYPLRKLTVDYDVDEIRQRYLRLYTGLIYDAMDHFGRPGQSMESGIYPLTHTMKVAGPAFTIRCISTPTLDDYIHNTRLGMLKSMSPGCIQVRDTQRDNSCGQFGEITATAARAAGCVGAVIDGSTRDSNYLIEMGFPTFARFRNPVEGRGRFMAVDYMIPIYVRGMDGKLVINPGDFIFGDNDGVVVVPKDMTIQVLEQAEEWFAGESKSRAAMAAGQDPFEVYDTYGRF